MVIRHSPRTLPTDDVDPEQACRILFPGNGSTSGSPPRIRSPNKSFNGNRNDHNSMRFTKIALAVSATFSAMSALAAIMAWNHSMTAHPNVLPQPAILSDAPVVVQRSQSKLIQAIRKAPMGSLGPAGTDRQHLHYYDTLFYTTLQYGADASSVIEVGCASDPFLKYLGWIDERLCVAPYFVQYADSSRKNILETNEIKAVTADFMEYQLPNDEKYDLLLCNQVLEHVPNPASFLKKLIASAKTSIISVPYNWEACGETCNHKTNYITVKMLRKWSAPYVPIYYKIVEEDGKGKNRKRVIVVYETS
jgi:hypothetical protein